MLNGKKIILKIFKDKENPNYWESIKNIFKHNLNEALEP